MEYTERLRQSGLSEGRRLPAEWEPVEMVLTAWPHENTDWSEMLDEIRTTYGHIINAISPYAPVLVIGPVAPDAKYFPGGKIPANVRYVYTPTNDTWTRDYGPITVVDTDGMKHLDFQFNGWGLKFAAASDNMTTARLCDSSVFPYARENHLGFTLEGGAIESDGNGLILTTASCMLNPNRNGDLSKKDIDSQLKAMLGAKNVAWLFNGELEGDDTDGHIDTLARLVPPGDTILFTGCQDPNDSHFEALDNMRKELQALRRDNDMPFNLIELPLPDAIYDPEDGSRLPATYANFLIVNGAVILPTYNQPLKDMTARMAIAAALPEYTIHEVDCRALIRQHGSLHCATMQIPKDLTK